MQRKSTPRPQPLPKRPQRNHAKSAADHQSSQDRNTPAQPQVDVQGVRVDDGAGGHGGAQEVVGGEERSGVGRVG